MTRMRPGALSAIKTSPLGARRTRRGLSRPLANLCTTKPDGTRRVAPSGWDTMVGLLVAESVETVGGKSAAVISLLIPGASARKQPNAERPVRIGETSARRAATYAIVTQRPKSH